jgi:hypothetical protein
MIISFLFMRITHCSLAGNVTINTTTHIFVRAYNAACLKTFPILYVTGSFGADTALLYFLGSVIMRGIVLGTQEQQ